MSTRSDHELENSKMDLDKFLVEEVGQFGKFQIRVLAQCVLSVFFIAWNINEFVFTAGRIETRCVISECEDPSNTEFSPTWIANAVPWSSGSMDHCKRFGNTSLSLPGNSTCPASLFNTDVLQLCQEYVYENTNTIVYDFNLGCDEWRRALVGTVRIGGMMVALAFIGYISDRWGRRNALAIGAFSGALLGVTRYWAPNYQVYTVLLFLESIAGCGSFSSAYIIATELLGPQYRVIGAALLSMAFALGTATLSLIAWVVADWRSLILSLYIPQFITIVCFWTMPESVRWLMIKGKFKESENILKEAARVNGKQISQKSLEDLQLNAKEEKTRNSSDKAPLVLMVLKNKRVMMRCFVTCLWFITTTFIYYGLSINALNLTGNIYLNYMIVAIIEIPGYVIVILLIDRLGRKPVVISSFWICATCQVAFMFISNEKATLSLVVYMLGKCAISVVISSVSIFTVELYPTDSRHRLYAFSSMVGRVGSMIAPLTPALGAKVFEELPFVLFGVMAFLAGLVTFLVPETLGSKLADTMEEALNVKEDIKITKL